MTSLKDAVQLFLFGFLAMVGALVLQVFFSIVTQLPLFGLTQFPDTTRLLPMLLWAIITEEAFRAMMVLRCKPYSTNHRATYNGLIFGSGFVLLELLGIAFNSAIQTSLPYIIGIITLHILLSIWYFSLVHRVHTTVSIIFYVLLGIIVHFSYNALILFLG